MFKLKKAFPGIYQYNAQYFTKNLLKDRSFPGESILKYKDFYFREWKAGECKIASVLPQLKEFPFQKHSTLLCLGEFSPVSISYLSDVIRIPGMILAVDPSAKVQGKLEHLMANRKNILSLLSDYSNSGNLQKDLSGFEVNAVLHENETNSIQHFIAVAKQFLPIGGRAVLLQKKNESFDQLIKEFSLHFDSVQVLNLPHFQEFSWVSGVKK